MGGSCETLTMFSDCACWVCGVRHRWKWRRIPWTWSCWRSRVSWLFSRWSLTWSMAWNLPRRPSSKQPSKVSEFAKLRSRFALEISTIAVKIWYFGRLLGIRPGSTLRLFPCLSFCFSYIYDAIRFHCFPAISAPLPSNPALFSLSFYCWMDLLRFVSTSS